MSQPPQNLPRRNFLGHSAALTAGAITTSAVASAAAATTSSPEGRPAREGRLPREVWIATIAQEGVNSTSPQAIAKEMLARMAEAAELQPDIICLPELVLFPGNRPPLQEMAESPLGDFAEPFVKFAKDHRCYVAYPGYTVDAGRYYNAVVFIDRRGEVCGEYRKMHPTTGEMRNHISPGPLEPAVVETDFGKVGAQICFDIEWHDGWRRLRDAGAEIVIFPSAFSAGRAVNMRAAQNQLVVASSTRKDTSKIVDVTGACVAATCRWNRWVCAPVNLEKAVLHTWPFNSRFDEIHAKYGRDVLITNFGEEEWTILESRSPEVRIADVLKEFELETYAEHIAKADAMQRERREAEA